jgi:hypothetical protein
MLLGLVEAVESHVDCDFYAMTLIVNLESDFKWYILLLKLGELMQEKNKGRFSSKSNLGERVFHSPILK